MPTNNRMKNIAFTDKQFRNLVLAVRIGNDVLGILGDVVPDPMYKKLSNTIEELESHLFEWATEFGASDMVEKFRGKLIMDEDMYEMIHELVDEYDDYIFWHELETRLGKRDFERTMTKEEEKYIEKHHGMLPERIHELYEKYGRSLRDMGLRDWKLRMTYEQR